MEKNVRKSAVSILVFQRNALLVLTLFLLIAVSALAVVAIRKETLTVFKAPEHKIDLKAAEKQGLYIAHLLLNRGLHNWDKQNEILFDWVAPAYAIPLKAKLAQGKQIITEQGKAFEWDGHEARVEMVNPHTLKIFVQGILSVYIPKKEDQKQLIEQEKGTYLLIFNLTDGKLLLKSFTKEKL